MVSDKRGIAVYLVVVLAMILFGLGAVMAFRTAFNISSQRRVRHSLEARYIAEAGLERALHLMRHGKTQIADELDYGGGKVALQIEPAAGPFGERLAEVLSRGTYQELHASLFARVELDPTFLKSSSDSSSTSASASSAAGIHITIVKSVLTLPEELGPTPDFAAAQKRMIERMKKANARYSEGLASVSRAELRWQLYKLAGSLGGSVASTDSETSTTSP